MLFLLAELRPHSARRETFPVQTIRKPYRRPTFGLGAERCNCQSSLSTHDEVGRTYAKNAYATNSFVAKHPSEALGAEDLRRCAALQGSPDGAALRWRAERLAEASPLAARRRERDAASPPE